MFFAIELAALALMVCCTVQLWRLSRRLIVERDKAMRDRDSARRQLFTQTELTSDWRLRAVSFEVAGKKHEKTIHTMEEHIAAERARGDKLAAALQVAEDKAKKLTQEAKEAREQTVKLRQQLSQPQNPQWTRVTDTSAESLRAAIAPGNPMDSFAREMANIFAYNGTADGQEELSDG